MQINPKKYVFFTLISLVTCLPAANAQTNGAHESSNSRLLTPQTMLAQGFALKCEFRENDTSSDVFVDIRFDADKGPEIEEARGANLVISQGGKTLVWVPINTEFDHETGSINRLYFSVDKDLLADTQIYLDYIQGIHAYYRVISIKEFYAARKK